MTSGFVHNAFLEANLLITLNLQKYNTTGIQPNVPFRICFRHKILVSAKLLSNIRPKPKLGHPGCIPTTVVSNK